MPTYRKLALGLGATLAAATVTFAGTMTSYASPAGPTSTSRPSASGVVPDPNAPHVGHVRGVSYGPGISINNPRSIHAFRVLHRDLLASGRTAAPDGVDTIHPSKGTSFNASTMGSQATQSVSTKIKPAQASTTLYTPTMYPSAGNSAGSCVEMSTAYFHTSQVVAAWDWCVAINFVAEVTIDKSFINTYTRHHNYSTQIIQTKPSDNTWTSYLYNYKTGKWEQFFQQHGSSQISPTTPGWDVYELYSELDGQGQSYACADLEGRRIEARGIMVGVNGNLVRADDTNAGQVYDHDDSEFHCNSFSYDMIKRLYHWKAIG
jgi:hypothetical protein